MGHYYQKAILDNFRGKVVNTTATQNSCWGFALDNTPNAKFCVGYTNMLVSKNAKMCVTPNVKHKICVTPNAKPQREPMEYRLRWVPNAKFSCWLCTCHVVCAHFIRVG